MDAETALASVDKAGNTGQQLIASGRRRADGPSRPAPTWQDAEVLEVVAQTEETATLRLRLTAGSGFVAGQYYNVRLSVEGRPRPVQRAYSVGSSPRPDPSAIELTVKRMDGGLVSPRLVDEVSAGSTLTVRGPYGSFTWSDDQDGPVLLIAAGSGVVPLVSIARLAEATHAEAMIWWRSAWTHRASRPRSTTEPPA